MKSSSFFDLIGIGLILGGSFLIHPALVLVILGVIALLHATRLP